MPHITDTVPKLLARFSESASSASLPFPQTTSHPFSFPTIHSSSESMAANKFATMLHRNTNRVTVTLVYALLEWVLIVLILLNSLFSYLITKFAKWVGLQPPCPWCSRVDHILEPGKKSTDLQSDLVCETHAAEISNLGFCSNHRKLAETHSMCEDCLASRPNHDDENSIRITHGLAFISWLSHENSESCENTKRCSCCNESLLPLEPSWGDGNYRSKGTLIIEALDDEEDEGNDKDPELERNDGEDEHQILSDIESFILREVAEDRSSSVSNLHSDEKDAEKDEKEDDLTITELDPSRNSETFPMQASSWEDISLEVINMHFENNVASDSHRMIPVELIDSFTSAKFEPCKLEEDLGEREQKIETFGTETPSEAELSILEGVALLTTMDENAEKTSMGELESLETSMSSLKNSTVLVEDLKQDSKAEAESSITEGAQALTNDGNNVESTTEKPDDAQEEDQSSTSDSDTEVQNAFDEFMAQNNLCKSQSLSYNGNNVEVAIEEDQSSTSDDDAEVPNAFDEFIAQNNLCPVKTGANDNELEKTTLVEESHGETSHQSSKCSEEDEIEEEDKLPETPSSADDLHYLHGKLMLLEKRESGAEESVDGSVASEAECGDPLSTIERLKTAVKAERKALSALYQELEEERSASAIAANQTMAMITRLQEEKAAMQMEALQYQRMMEEQSEYDQEALQLLNELMIKREKEKQELEKELEEYKQKVMEYEAKEKLRVLRRMKNGSVKCRESSSSCSCSNVGETEELSIDLNCEAREEDNSFFNHHQSSHNNTTADTVSSLEEMTLDCVKHVSALDNSLAEFEEEKLSILDQLKALEEKLITLGENEQFLDDKDFNENCIFSSPEDNMYSNGVSDDKHSLRRPMGSLAKRLLPYLDAADNETEEEEAYAFGRQMEPESADMQKQNSGPALETDNMKVSIEEEVDHVYERLQALETDADFLRHCMGSMQKGDKGMDLLQEILLHLRDLKDVELRLKNLDDDPLG